MPRVVIAGGGQAGYQCAESLRQNGYAGAIVLASQEPRMPYQRPPLSKAYLLGNTDRERLQFRTGDYYAQHEIGLLLDTRVTGLDRPVREVELSSGERLAYDQLVLATGARVRTLPVPGADLEGVCTLRTLDDADLLAASLRTAERVVVIGAGFIGLEFAAVARQLGKTVSVIEARDRVMARAVPGVLSDYFVRLHRHHGVDIVCETVVAEIVGSAGRVASVHCRDGRIFSADLVVVGIGVLPNVELAAEAGLEVDDGIVVDPGGRTSDPDIFAAGDCASYAHPCAGHRLRLESVQNAADQARTVAATIAGHDRPYVAVPWFWSDQYDARLQMVGLSAGCDRHVIRGTRDGGRFSVFHYRGGVLRAIDSINRPADHILGRNLLARGVSPSPEQATDEAFPLRSLLDGT